MWSEFFEKMLAVNLKKIKIFGTMKILNNFEFFHVGSRTFTRMQHGIFEKIKHCVDIQNEQLNLPTIKKPINFSFKEFAMICRLT